MLVKAMPEENTKDKKEVLLDKVMELLHITMEENIQDIGRITKCMEKVLYIILMIK